MSPAMAGDTGHLLSRKIPSPPAGPRAHIVGAIRSRTKTAKEDPAPEDGVLWPRLFADKAPRSAGLPGIMGLPGGRHMYPVRFMTGPRAPHDRYLRCCSGLWIFFIMVNGAWLPTDKTGQSWAKLDFWFLPSVCFGQRGCLHLVAGRPWDGTPGINSQFYNYTIWSNLVLI